MSPDQNTRSEAAQHPMLLWTIALSVWGCYQPGSPEGCCRCSCTIREEERPTRRRRPYHTDLLVAQCIPCATGFDPESIRKDNKATGGVPQLLQSTCWLHVGLKRNKRKKSGHVPVTVHHFLGSNQIRTIDAKEYDARPAPYKSPPKEFEAEGGRERRSIKSKQSR